MTCCCCKRTLHTIENLDYSEVDIKHFTRQSILPTQTVNKIITFDIITVLTVLHCTPIIRYVQASIYVYLPVLPLF